MTDLNPKQLAQKFFDDTNLPQKPSVEDLNRIYILACEKYLNKEMSSHEFSGISASICYDFVEKTPEISYKDLATASFEGAELNFYIGNIEIYSNPKSPKDQQALDHSIDVVRRTENIIKKFLNNHTDSNYEIN